MKKVFLMGLILLVGAVPGSADTSICVFMDNVKTSAQKNFESIRMEEADKHNAMIEPLRKQLHAAEKAIIALQGEIQKLDDKEAIKSKQEELDKGAKEYRELSLKLQKAVDESRKKFDEKLSAMGERFTTKLKKVIDTISKKQGCSVTLPGSLLLYHSDSNKKGVSDITERIVEKMNEEMPRVEG